MVGLGQLLDESSLHCVRRPDARVAVGLELASHREALRPLAVAADLVEDPELVLDVMAVLVCDHVGLDKRCTADTKAGLELVEESEVDVHELVARAIERTDL